VKTSILSLHTFTETIN